MLPIEQLPNKLRMFVFNTDNGRPMPGVPIRATIGLSSSNAGEQSVDLGVLASNHAGYVSFDIRSKKTFFSRHPYVADEITTLAVEIPLNPPFSLDLLPHISSPLPPQLIPIPLPPEIAHHHFHSPSHNSIQNPDVDDWLVSSDSFGTSPSAMIGEDGCEIMLPSHVPERTVRFHQLFRRPSSDEFPYMRFSPEPGYIQNPPREMGWPENLFYKEGELHNYELVWQPINYGLGNILYSLTLAPCEAVRLAVVDWSREEEAGRSDSVRLADDLTHSLRRDRSIDETVNAVLQEHQNGFSFMNAMAGVGGAGGAMGGGMPMGGGGSPMGGSGGGGGGGSMAGAGNFGATGSNAIGFALANTSGNRDVEVKTFQGLVDRISQASHLVRDLRSTVIVQAGQRELETVQTRIVRNHNHSHALTVQYYEVVRHYLVRAILQAVQPAILIKYPSRTFELNEETLSWLNKHASVLRANLLDSRFSPIFDVLNRLISAYDSGERVIQQPRLRGLVVNVKTGAGEPDGAGATEHNRVKLLLVKSNGRPWVKRLGWGFRDASSYLKAFDIMPHYFLDSLTRASDYWVNHPYEPTASNTYFVDLTYLQESVPDTETPSQGPEKVSPAAIRQMGIVFWRDGDNKWNCESLTIHGVIEYPNDQHPELELVKILDTGATGEDLPHFIFNGDQLWDVNFETASARLRSFLQGYNLFGEFIEHLQHNQQYYNALVWLTENPHERAVRFASYSYRGAPLIEKIENRPIDVIGDYVAFLRIKEPAHDGQDEIATDDLPMILSQRIISLPTRGAFAETRLSNCNSSERIDDTRFWDWQMSPCPDEPTEIAPITMGSRRSPYDGTPSTLPASGLSITNPPDAPAPGGMKEVMDLLATSNIFRDMSGIEQLGPLLQKLVEVAGEVEKARINANAELAGQLGSAAAQSSSARPVSHPSSGEMGGLLPSGTSVPDPIAEARATGREAATAENMINRNIQDPAERRQQQEQLTERVTGQVGRRSRGSARETNGSDEMNLSFHFKTDQSRPVRGGYEVVVTHIDGEGGTRIDTTGGPGPFGHDNNVIVPVPSNWQNVRVTVSVREVTIIGEGDLENLRTLIDGVSRAFFGGSTSRTFELETSSGGFTIDSDQAYTRIFDVVFRTEERRIAVSTSVEMQAAIEGQIQAGVVVTGVEFTGSLTGGTTTTVGGELVFHTLTGYLDVIRHNS